MSVHEYGYYWVAEQYDYLGGITASNIGSAAYYVEYCATASESSTVTNLCKIGGQTLRVGTGSNDVSVQYIGASGISTIPTGRGLGAGEHFTLGFDYDPSRTGSELEVYFWVDDGLGLLKAGSASPGEFLEDLNTVTTIAGDAVRISRIVVKAGGINGTETHHYNANYVQTAPGEFRVRQAGDGGGIWNINATTERESSTKDQPFELHNGISEVNGESVPQTITFGDTAQTITLPPTLTSGELLFSGVPVQYSYNQGAGTATFDAPNMGDLAGLTTIGEGNTISFDGNEISIITAVPAPYAVVDLIGPIYTGESSYTYGSDFTPAVGWQHVFNADEVDVYPDNQFDIVSTDGVIDFTGYSVDPATGMQQYQVSNAGTITLPSVSITTSPQTVTVGDNITLSADVTDADSVLWSANLGGAFENGAQSSTTFTPSEAGSLELTLTGTNAEGSASDSVLMTVEDPQVIPTASITTAPNTANTGEQYNIEATVTDADSVLWACTSGQSPTFGDPSVASTTIIFNEDDEHTIEITATSSTGDTASDSFTVTASTVVVESVLNLTVTGIGTGSRAVVLHDRNTREVVFDGSMTFNNDVGSVTLTGVDVGTEIYGVWFGTNPPVTGTGVYGVTE